MQKSAINIYGTNFSVVYYQTPLQGGRVYIIVSNTNKEMLMPVECQKARS